MNGRTGSSAQGHVELGHSNVYARVLDHGQRLVAKTAPAQVEKQNHAEQDLVQSMDNGPNGNLGMNAQDLVVVDSKHVLACAPILLLLTAEEIAVGAGATPDLVEPTIVQSMETGPRGQTGESALGRVVVDCIPV